MSFSASFIDDVDPRVIKEGSWRVGGKPKSDSYRGTLSFTNTVGDLMKVNFNGTSIAVFGLFDVDSEGVVTNYTIDGAPPAQVTTPPAQGDVTYQQFWVKKGLASGPHTLQITMDKLHTQYGGSLWFDYFQVDVNLNSNTGDQQLNFTGSPLPTSSSSDHRSHLPTGTIIGIVIGALFFLLGVVFLFLMWRRMRRDSRVAPPNETNDALRQSSIQPFILSQHAQDPSTSSSQRVAASSSERLLFDPSLPVRGPPPRTGNHKSTIMSFIRNPASAPPSADPRPKGIGASSSEGTSGSTLPPGAQPPTLPPVPHLPQLSLTPSTGEPSTTTSASPAPNQNPGPIEDNTLTATLVPSSPVGTTIVPDGEEETGFTSPRQHVDSGMREPGVILAHSAIQTRVELPPVYSPV